MTPIHTMHNNMQLTIATSCFLVVLVLVGQIRRSFAIAFRLNSFSQLKEHSTVSTSLSLVFLAHKRNDLMALPDF